MLHDLAVVGVFFAMLIAPCVITLRAQRDTDESPAPPSNPLPRTR